MKISPRVRFWWIYFTLGLIGVIVAILFKEQFIWQEVMTGSLLAIGCFIVLGVFKWFEKYLQDKNRNFIKKISQILALLSFSAIFYSPFIVLILFRNTFSRSIPMFVIAVVGVTVQHKYMKLYNN